MLKKTRKQEIKPPKPTREKITIVLDSDILDFFRARASQPDAPKYQTQINNELRRVVESSKRETESGLSAVESSMLENEVFVKSLKEKMNKA